MEVIILNNKDIYNFYSEISFVKVVMWVAYTFVWLIMVMVFLGGVGAGYFNSVIDRTNIIIFYIFWGVIYLAVYILLYRYTFKKNNKSIRCVAMCLFSILILNVTFWGSVKVANLSYSKFSAESWDNNKNERIFMLEDLVGNHNIIGMDVEEVKKLLGKPDGSYYNPYSQCEGIGYVSGKAYITFWIDNGKISGYMV